MFLHFNPIPPSRQVIPKAPPTPASPLPMALGVVFPFVINLTNQTPSVPPGPNMPCQGPLEKGSGDEEMPGVKFFMISCDDKRCPGWVIYSP